MIQNSISFNKEEEKSLSNVRIEKYIKILVAPKTLIIDN